MASFNVTAPYLRPSDTTTTRPEPVLRRNSYDDPATSALTLAAGSMLRSYTISLSFCCQEITVWTQITPPTPPDMERMTCGVGRRALRMSRYARRTHALSRLFPLKPHDTHSLSIPC